MSNYAVKYEQKSDWKSDLSLFSYGSWKCMYEDFLIEYIGPSNCAHYWMWNN